MFILPPERALRVLVVATREDRIERIAKQEGLDRDDAEHRLDVLDVERREFLKHHFRGDPDDPTRYDLCLNTGSLGLAGAVDATCAALAARFDADNVPRT